MQLYLVCALVFALIVAIFAVQNTTMVAIIFLLWEFRVSLVLVILGAAAIGALCVFLVGAFKNIGTWRKQRELQGKNKLLSDKVTELENKIKDLEEHQRNIDLSNESKEENESKESGQATKDE